MNLLYYPNKFLDKKLDTVEIENMDFDPNELKAEMSDIMLSNQGIGLSASQVGLNKQLFIMGNTRDDIVMVINPRVLEHTERTTLAHEGCLSFPNLFMTVTRPAEILVEYYDENLELVTQPVSEYSARLFLHEFDHLNGITFKDRVTRMKYDLAKKKADKLTKKLNRV